jgi:cell wall assembly regulator SMI1
MSSEIEDIYQRLSSIARTQSVDLKLFPGATIDSIDTLEAAISRVAGARTTIPEDFREFMLVHDGFYAYFDPIGYHSRIDGVLSMYLENVPNINGAQRASTVSGAVKPILYSPFRLPFGGETVSWCLDLDPLEGGVVGQVIWVDVEGDAVGRVCDSYADFLRLVIEAYEREDDPDWSSVFESYY